MADQDPNDKYTMSRDESFEGKAHPGTALEPDELPESPPEFTKYVAPRQETKAAPAAHPTSELSSTPSHKPGKPSSGTHPTSELHVKPKGRR